MRHVNVVLVTGHDAVGQGAKSSSTGMTECAFWRMWAPSLHRALQAKGIFVRTLHRVEEIKPWSVRQEELVDRVNQLHPDLVVDLHFNAYDGLVAGCTCVVHPASEKGQLAGELVRDAVAKAQGTKALGLQKMTDSWSGSELHILTRTKAPAIILEPCFADVAKDWQAMVSGLESGRTQEYFAEAVEAYLREARVTGWGAV